MALKDLPADRNTTRVFCIPVQVSFRMDGPHGLLAYLEKVLARQVG